MFRRFLFIIIGLGLLTAACTSAGLPSSFEDQDNRAEKQFVAACQGSLDDEEDPEYCQCAFYTVASQLTFEEFLELDEQLKDDPGSLSQEDRARFESVSSPCAFSAADVTN